MGEGGGEGCRVLCKAQGDSPIKLTVFKGVTVQVCGVHPLPCNEALFFELAFKICLPHQSVS